MSKVVTCKKIFVGVPEEDFIKVNKCIIEPLIDCTHHGLTIECYTDHDVKLGQTKTSSVADLVDKCHHTFIVLTRNSVEKGWIKYKTCLALQKSLRDCKLCLALILFDVDASLVLDARFGLLTQAMIINVDTNKDTWKLTMIDQIIHHIKESKPVTPIQIAASLSVGQVWSHFTGYARNVLPKLEDCIKSSKWYKNCPSCFPLIEFNLIPQSAVSKESLTEYSNYIKYEGDLPLICSERGSFKRRPYRLSVYMIHDIHTDQFYYFVGQIPNTLSILSKLEHRKIHMNSNSKSHDKLVICEGERKLQVDRFYYTYNRLVNHPRNKQCNGKVKFVRFSNDEDVYNLLLTAVKEECDSRDRFHSRQIQRTKVCVMSDEDIPSDIQTANEVKQYLKNNGVDLVEYTRPGQTMFPSFNNAIKQAQWLVIILSDQSLKKSGSDYMLFRTRMFLYKNVMEHKLCIVPILVNIEEDDIPQDILAVTYLKKSEHHYKQNLIEILNCDNIHMEATVSSHDVHQGLAWAYVLNYLEVTLEDLQSRLEEIRLRTSGRKLYKKLFIVVPSSCGSKILGSLDKDKDGHLIDSSFYQLEEIHYKVHAVGGVMNRDYQLITYVIKTGETEYVVAVEYPNAVLCLQEMSELFPLSGLSRADLHDEAWKFKELAQNIIDNTSNVHNKAKLIYYDDCKLTVADAMRQVLQDEDDDMFL